MAALLYRPDQRELFSLSRLTRMGDGKVLMEVLQAELDVTLKRMVDTDSTTDVAKLQGRARFLTDFLALLAEYSKKDVPLG